MTDFLGAGELGDAAREGVRDVVDVFPDDPVLSGPDSGGGVGIGSRDDELALRGQSLGGGCEQHREVGNVLDQLTGDDHVERTPSRQRAETGAEIVCDRVVAATLHLRVGPAR